MSHTFEKTILIFAAWQLKCFHPYRKEVGINRRDKKYHLDIVGIFFTKRHGSGIIELELDCAWKLFYSDTDSSMSAQAGVRIPSSLYLSCQTVFNWIPLR